MIWVHQQGQVPHLQHTEIKFSYLAVKQMITESWMISGVMMLINKNGVRFKFKKVLLQEVDILALFMETKCTFMAAFLN